MRFLRARISDIFQDMKRLLEEPLNFVGSNTDTASSTAMRNAATSTDGGAAPAPWRLVNVVPQFDVHGRAVHYGSGLGGIMMAAAAANSGMGFDGSNIDPSLLEGSFDDDVALLYRKVSKPADLTAVKMTCILPYAMEEVAPYLADLRRRKEWDLKFHKGKCLEVRHTQEYTNANGPQALQQQPQGQSLQYPEIQADIVHMVFKSFSSPYKYRDVVLLRAFAAVDKTRADFDAQGFKARQTLASATTSPATAAAGASATGSAYHQMNQQQQQQQSGSGSDSPRNGSGAGAGTGAGEAEDPIFSGEGYFADGGLLFGSRSVLHAAGPELKDNVRAVLYPTGYALTPLRDQAVLVHALPGSDEVSGGGAQVLSTPGCACLLTFVAQLDRESVLIVAPDLLGETNELRHTFANLKACLARDRGLRTLQPSRHTHALRQVAGRPPEASPSSSSATTSSAHGRAQSVLGSQGIPITYGQRRGGGGGEEGEGGFGVSASSSPQQQFQQRGSSNTVAHSPQQPQQPQVRGSLPVIPEKR
jgi:hypothetical protein